jgi:hypothetical protein
MNTNDSRFELVRRCHDGEASTGELAQLDASLREDADFRQAYVSYVNLDVALSAVAKAETRLSTTRPSSGPVRNVWFSWRPLTAAAAGILFGIFCSSVVSGYVAQHISTTKTPLPVFDASFEETKSLDKGLPHHADQWGVRSAQAVAAENGVRPLEGQHMLRMEPIVISEQDENRYSHACQVLDLRSLLSEAASGAMEVQVAASFCAPPSAATARYIIRVVALNEPPETATEDVWSKADDAGVVSLKQRFVTETGDSDWHTFSVKMPLPPGAQSLVVVLSVISPKGETIQAPVRYLDDVQVSLLPSPTIQQ